MAFERGKTTDKLEVIGEIQNKKHTGTLITFLPDPDDLHHHDRIQVRASWRRRLRELAFFNPGLEITLTDERTEPRSKRDFYLQGRHRGIRQAARRNKQFIHPKPIVIPASARSRWTIKSRSFRRCACCNTTTAYNDQILCFANSIPNPDGGTHLDRLPHGPDPRHQPVRAANNLLRKKTRRFQATTCARVWSAC